MVEETRQRLTETARRLFAEKGYESTSVADILKNAGANSGSLYHFFSTKQDLLLEVLRGYRDGDRAHLTMHSQAATLSDQDIADIAAYFAGKPLVPTGKAPGSVPQAVTLCVSCHGQDGVAIAPLYPSLAGQHQDYLVRALDEYRKGGRKNPVMKGFAASLKDQDIAVIAQYFSGLAPSLSTESRPYTWLTAH